MAEQAARNYKTNREDWGSITDKRKNGKLTASYVGPDGNRYYGPVTYTSRTDARAWLAKQRTAIGNGTWRSPKTVNAETFDVYAKTWVSQRVKSTGKPLAPRTRAEYERFLSKGIGKEFSKDHLQAITAGRIRTWHAERTRDAGATAAVKEAQVLRAILNTAIRDRIIEGQNPVPPELTRTSTGQTHRPPTPDELATILSVIEPEFRMAVVLAAVGGLRIGEWKALRRRDLTLREDGRYAVSITRQAQYVPGHGWVVGAPKSAAGVRVQILPGFLTDDVARHLESFTGEVSGVAAVGTEATEPVHSRFRVAGRLGPGSGRGWDQGHGARARPKALRTDELRDHRSHVG